MNCSINTIITSKLIKAFLYFIVPHQGGFFYRLIKIVFRIAFCSKFLLCFNFYRPHIPSSSVERFAFITRQQSFLFISRFISEAINRYNFLEINSLLMLKPLYRGLGRYKIFYKENFYFLFFKNAWQVVFKCLGQ